MVRPTCISDHCAVTIHPLLKEVASTCICVIVATTRLLSLRVFLLLKKIARPMIIMRERNSATIRTVSVSMLSARLLVYLYFVENESPKQVYTKSASRAIKRA